MSFWKKWFGVHTSPRPAMRPSSLRVESLERRDVLSATPLPVLMVIADQNDFYYREYSDTRDALLAQGVNVVVAATTTAASIPHANTGQPANSNGAVVPDIALADVNPEDYSAIAFVGGWGASMYQYAYNDPNFDGIADNYYWHTPYNGDAFLNDGIIAPQKVQVNNLINEFLAADKPVAGICHGVTVLAWARVDGVSPLAGRQVSVPLTVGSPNQFYAGAERVYPYSSGQYDQVVANGGIANTVSGQYGDPTTVADDVVVDGRIITAENYDSASAFGTVIAQQVWANLPPEAPIDTNQAPTLQAANFVLPENSAANTVVGQVIGNDADVGQVLTYSIVGGNTNGAFSINPSTGEIRVANAAALNFEVQPQFTLSVRVVDDADQPAEAFADVLVQLTDVYEPLQTIAGNLVITGTSGADIIYVWSHGPHAIGVSMNGQFLGVHPVEPTRGAIVHAGAGNDQVFATDLHRPMMAYGGDGHDLIVGGAMGDYVEGGAGIDRVWGGLGNDFLRGGADDDFLFGREGDDILLGDAGHDFLDGFEGRDLMIGGLGVDRLFGGGEEDLLIGGTTAHDASFPHLKEISQLWSAPLPMANRVASLASLLNRNTVQDDEAVDHLIGGMGDDWVFTFELDRTY